MSLNGLKGAFNKRNGIFSDNKKEEVKSSTDDVIKNLNSLSFDEDKKKSNKHVHGPNCNHSHNEQHKPHEHHTHESSCNHYFDQLSNNEKDNVVKLSKLIADFIVSTITGTESGFYKQFRQKKIVDKLNDSTFMKVAIATAHVNYFNILYKSLILKNDEYVTKKFLSMHNIMNHSYICLLNIIFKVCVDVHQIIPRSEMIVNCYENYMLIVKAMLDNINPFIIDMLKEMLSHNCNGTDISTCNPDEPMFHIGSKEEMNKHGASFQI
jgi:hypothetical protein